MRIVWTRTARLGLNALFDQVATDSPMYAERFTDRIADAINALAETPRIGQIVPEAKLEHIRQRIVQSQRVIYAIDDERQVVNILALVHVRQDLAARDGKPWE